MFSLLELFLRLKVKCNNYASEKIEKRIIVPTVLIRFIFEAASLTSDNLNSDWSKMNATSDETQFYELNYEIWEEVNTGIAHVFRKCS